MITADDMTCCASCGIAENDGIKLKTCTACKSVRYCSIKCQKDHRLHHKRECKKRAEESRDEVLFRQPESSHLGDCEICCQPLLLDERKSTLMPCCSKMVCNSCDMRNRMTEVDRAPSPDVSTLASILTQSESAETNPFRNIATLFKSMPRAELRCPFCRQPRSLNDQEKIEKMLMKRIEVNDPVAMCKMGKQRYREGDYSTAFEWYTKAAGLGDTGAHYLLSCLFLKGEGVEKDKKKSIYHMEQAAIGGHPSARHYLGIIEGSNGRRERAAKHWIIASKLGHDDSINSLRGFNEKGYVSKEDFSEALRGHQAAAEATKSPYRMATDMFSHHDNY